MVNSKTFNLRVSLSSLKLNVKSIKKALTVLALANLLASLAVSLPGTLLVASLPPPARRTRARACHRVTRGAVMTRTRVSTAGAPAARGTGHGAAPTSVAVMTRARVRGNTRAVLTSRPESEDKIIIDCLNSATSLCDIQLPSTYYITDVDLMQI